MELPGREDSFTVSCNLWRLKKSLLRTSAENYIGKVRGLLGPDRQITLLDRVTTWHDETIDIALGPSTCPTCHGRTWLVRRKEGVDNPWMQDECRQEAIHAGQSERADVEVNNSSAQLNGVRQGRTTVLCEDYVSGLSAPTDEDNVGRPRESPGSISGSTSRTR